MTSTVRPYARNSPSNNISSGAVALPFAPTLGGRPASRVSPPTSRLTTPLAAPPPPLQLDANRASSNMGRKVPYAGAEHTLGPTFSEEEDGDDSEWIASQMAALGLDPTGKPYNGDMAIHSSGRMRSQANAQAHAQAAHEARIQQQQRQQQMQQQQQQLQYQTLAQLQVQQQQLAQAILLAQHTGQPTQPYRQALAIIQAQQAALMSAPVFQSPITRSAQSQRAPHPARNQSSASRGLTLHDQQPYDQPKSAAEQRSALAAQVQANLQARTRRQGESTNEKDIRARFESTPNTLNANAYITPQTASNPVFSPVDSPFTSGWRSHLDTPSSQVASPSEQPLRSAPLQSNRFTTSQGSSLSAFLARRRATDESSVSGDSETASISTDAAAMSRAGTAQTSPNPSISDQEKVKVQNILGHGRPTNVPTSARAWTAPLQNQATPEISITATPRAASFAGGAGRSLAIRQPCGPPGEAKELREKNFQSRLRRQAGLNLGMLGRRTETPLSTPVLE